MPRARRTDPLHTWPRTRLCELLSIRYPIVQGPFGGGLSSTTLLAAVSNAGGLGSFGAHHLPPDEITALLGELRSATANPFAVNLWVSNHDVPESELTRERFDSAIERLRPVYEAADVEPPPFPAQFWFTFEEQVGPILAAAPPVLSFVAGIPAENVLEESRERGILTIGTATTPDEAVAFDEAGVDAIVASGFEAGGHRGAFLLPADESLVGTFALTRIATNEVSAPVVSAGGIVDARGIVAALALGAEGVQIGTAFLATDESGTTDEHRALLRSPASRSTRLTRVLTGRPARVIPNRLTDELIGPGEFAPYPYQRYLLRPVIAAARSQGRTDLASLWSGQGAPLLEHARAADLFAALVRGTEQLLHASAKPLSS